MSKLIKNLSEDEAVREVLEAEQELKEGKILRGDLRDLMRRFAAKDPSVDLESPSG